MPQQTADASPVTRLDSAVLRAAAFSGIDFLDIKAFVAVAQSRNLSEAARQLHVTPSTLSRRMKALELALGTALFTQRAQAGRLTEAGQALCRHANQWSAFYAETLDALNSRKPEVSRKLRLVCTNIALPLVVTPLLRTQAAGALAEGFNFRDVTSRRVLKEVTEGTADVGICMLPSLDGIELEHWLLKSAPLGLLSSPTMRIPANISSLQDLWNTPLARLSDDMVLPQALRAAGTPFDRYFDSEVVCDSMGAAFAAAQSAKVATIVSAIASAHPAASGLRFLPLPQLLPPLHLTLVTRPHLSMDSTSRHWITMIRDILKAP